MASMGGARLMTLSVLGMAACDGSEPAASPYTVHIDTIGQIPHVFNAGDGPPWRVVEFLRLGGEGAGDPQEFGQITGVVATSDGTVFVADGMAKEIRAFAPDGVFRWRTGRDGGGPAEFRSLTSLGTLGDTIVTLDPGNGRVGLIGSDGEWLGQRQYRRVSGPNMRIFQTGASEFAVPSLTGEMSMRFVRHGPHAAVAGFALQPPGGLQNHYVFCRHDRGFVYFVPERAPYQLRIPAPGGRLLDVWGGAYRLVFLGANEDTVRVVERDVPSRTPSDAEWDDQIAQFDSMMNPLTGLQCEPNRPVRPDSMELIRDVFFDEREWMWVERRTPDGFVLDAFDRTGALRGTVAIPSRVEDVPIYIRNNRMYLVVEDDLGVHAVRGLEIAT